MNIKNDPLGQIYSSLSSREDGLTSIEVHQKSMTFGKNILPEKKKNYLKMFAKEFISPLVLLLFVAILISLSIPFFEHESIALHESIEAITIFIILIFNALLGFFQELKAENTLNALKQLQPEVCTVLRDEKLSQVSAENIVPGDIISLSEGEKIPADIRLIEAVECKVNESLLTGESLPVIKDVYESEKNILFSGSELLSGRAKGIVIAIGLDTQIGKIAQMISSVKKPQTPMEKKLSLLGKRIGIAVVSICAVVFGLALLQDDIQIIDALLAAVALAVGAVPEGLPAVMTISLAIGVAIMARKNALIRELKAVETLGSITVIASDKTGTITENKMSVQEIFLPIFSEHQSGKFLYKNEFKKVSDARFFEILENCNDAVLPNIGDPTEIGLLQLSEKFSAQKYKRISEIPFSSEKKWMSTTHIIDSKEIEFIKGAPEIIAEFCDPSFRENIISASIQMAEKGLRTIGGAYRISGEKFAKFSGIAGLQDSAREGVAESITLAKQAGIRTMMITGDHAVTAKAIAHEVGIEGEVREGQELQKISDSELQKVVQKISIYARVSPEHKVRICNALQKNGEIVGMTGDGVNDAPAITQAQVGISMGKVGTSVARNASDMVLLDDNFTTIIHGIAEGRRIFANIKKSIIFLLATNFAEVFLLFFALAFYMPLPLIPIQLLLINLLTDSFPALSLATEKPEKNLMNHPPKPVSEGFLKGSFLKIISIGSFVGALVLGLFYFSLNSLNLLQAQTIAFVDLSIIELVLIFSLRTNENIFHSGKNPWIIGASLLGLCLILLLLYSPVQSFVSLSPFPIIWWIWIIITAFISLAFVEGWKKILK